MHTASLLVLIYFLDSGSSIFNLQDSFGSSMLSNILLQNLRKTQAQNKKRCSLKLVILEEYPFYVTTDAFEFEILHSILEPVELIFQSPSKTLVNSSLVSPEITSAKPIFNNNCWTIFIIISNQVQISGFPYASVGHPARDQFIFISSSYSALYSFLTKTQALNLIRRKYGVYFYKSIENNTLPRIHIRYIAEPSIYTGKFSTFLNFPQERQSEQFNNLNGRVLQVAQVNFGILFKRLPNTTEHVGIFSDLFTETRKRTNFSMNFYNEHLKPGSINKTTKLWNGIMGSLQQPYGGADVCAGLGISFARYPYVDYSTEIYRGPITFTLIEPKAHVHWYALVAPLSLIVWFLTVGAVLGLIMTFICLAFWNSKFSVSLLAESVLSPYAIVLEQSVRMTDGTATWKLGAILCIILNFVVGTAYKSNLVGFLTFPAKPIFPRSFYDLYKQKDFGMTLLTVGGMENEVFKTSTSPMMQDFAKRLNFWSIKNTGKCMDQSKMACVSWRNLLQVGVIKHDIGKGRMSRNSRIFMADDKDPVMYADCSAAYKKGSIFKDTMNKYFAFARDTGIVDKFLSRFWLEEKERIRSSLERNGEKDVAVKVTEDGSEGVEESGRPLALKVRNFITVGYAYILGALLALLCFFCERK